MSRIDEALKQAGLKTQGDRIADPAPAALDSFPTAYGSPSETPRNAAGGFDRQSIEPSVPVQAPALAPPLRDARTMSAEKLVLHETTGQATVEQYRRVAAMLHQLQEERGTKIVMVASAQPGEGKTLTAANLALTLSESYRRHVLLIDADLRRPSLATLFRLQSPTGLSERLKGDGRNPLRVLELSQYLALLPGGKPDPDPMAGLTSGRMQQIIQQGAANYDWVILDTPPVGLQSDAHLLAAMVEATILVIGAGRTQFSAVQHAIETIGRDKIVGVVLNRVDPGGMSEAAYYSYYGPEAVAQSKGVARSRAIG